MFLKKKSNRSAIDLFLEVKPFGKSEWSKDIEVAGGNIVRFRVHVVNTGDNILRCLTVRNSLPFGVCYIPGSTTIVNVAHPDGIILSDNINTDLGANLGDYGSGAGAWIYFNATADGGKDLRCIVEASAGFKAGVVADSVCVSCV